MAKRRSTKQTSSVASWWADFSAFWLSSRRQRLTLAGLLMGVWLLVFANQWLYVSKEIARPQRFLGVQAETIYVPPVATLRLASLGHQSFVADLLFLRVAHYFVDHLLSDSHMPFIDLYLNAIWGLDAHNRTTYRWGAQVIKFGQQIDEQVNARANHFARMGMVYFPQDGWLYHEIAYNLFAYRTRYDEIEGKRRERLALRYLALAYQMPGFSFDPNYLAHQYARAGMMDDSVKAAMASYAEGTAEQRRELRVRLRQRNRADAAEILAWLDETRRRDWPHLNETLATIVGPRRIAAPPIEYWKVENWLPERPVDEKLLDELGIVALHPPRGLLDGGVAISEDEEIAHAGRVAPPEDTGPPPALRNIFLDAAPATTTPTVPTAAPSGATPTNAPPNPTQDTP